MTRLKSLSNDTIRLFILISLVCFLWLYGSMTWSSASSLKSKVTLQTRRMNSLIEVIERYKELPEAKNISSSNEDPMVIISSLVDRMDLKDNLVQISALSKGVSVQLTRLYFKKSLAFLDQLSRKGLDVDSAELRYVPEGGKRMMSMTLIVTVPK